MQMSEEQTCFLALAKASARIAVRDMGCELFVSVAGREALVAERN
jgi:hypothetical protein